MNAAQNGARTFYKQLESLQQRHLQSANAFGRVLVNWNAPHNHDGPTIPLLAAVTANTQGTAECMLPKMVLEGSINS